MDADLSKLSDKELVEFMAGSETRISGNKCLPKNGGAALTKP